MVSTPTRRLSREDRRAQILDAACSVFAATGYAATGLEDVARSAGVTRAILYRHFDSKGDLYRAVLGRARERLAHRVGAPDYDQTILAALMAGAQADPDGFRLLFTHAAREPEFSAEVAAFEAHMRAMAREQVAEFVDPEWLEWTAALVPSVTTAAIVAWVEVGMPDPSTALRRIRHVVHAVVTAPPD